VSCESAFGTVDVEEIDFPANIYCLSSYAAVICDHSEMERECNVKNKVERDVFR
jgi:hypothetical protein